MPNSGISVRSSIVWWQEKQNMRPWTAIDIAVPYRFADYAAGRDPVLAAALGYQDRPSLGKALLSAAEAGGKEAVRKAADRYRLDPANRYDDIALHMSRAAELLHASKRPDEALLVAELATSHYPNYRDAFLVQAYLAEANGRKETAREAGKRALQLDPNNRLARTLIERLGS
jgi:tetratricopeptide (TPR) repeat protein